jgi:RNA polymerase sigma-70 factor (ECF subfamily)
LKQYSVKQYGSRDHHPRPNAASTRQVRGEILDLIPSLRAFAQSLTRDPTEADDLLQDTLLKALLNIERFTPGTNLRAWMFTIERNTFYTNCKRKHREVALNADEAEEIPSEPLQDWPLKVRALQEAMQQLPGDQKEALLLVGGEGLRYEEAADACGCALGTIKSRVSRGRARLMKLLDVEEHGDFLSETPQA